jgi:hypothetical protein
MWAYILLVKKIRRKFMTVTFNNNERLSGLNRIPFFARGINDEKKIDEKSDHNTVSFPPPPPPFDPIDPGQVPQVNPVVEDTANDGDSPSPQAYCVAAPLALFKMLAKSILTTTDPDSVAWKAIQQTDEQLMEKLEKAGIVQIFSGRGHKGITEMNEEVKKALGNDNLRVEPPNPGDQDEHRHVASAAVIKVDGRWLGGDGNQIELEPTSITLKSGKKVSGSEANNVLRYTNGNRTFYAVPIILPNGTKCLQYFSSEYVAGDEAAQQKYWQDLLNGAKPAGSVTLIFPDGNVKSSGALAGADSISAPEADVSEMNYDAAWDWNYAKTEATGGGSAKVVARGRAPQEIIIDDAFMCCLVL